ncbi:hypothetical protein HMPREF0497_1236, partial [Lentilactobacillus buchneri ATCC 11577]
MTKKLATLNLKGKSDSTIAKETKAAKNTVREDADKIDTANAAITAAKTKIDTADDYLNKANGYADQNAAYNDLENQIEAQQRALSATKSSSKKKSIDDKIKSL